MLKLLVVVLSMLIVFPETVRADDKQVFHGWPQQIASHPEMELSKDGKEREGQYIIIDMSGSITRSVCPYTCEMRGLPREHCRTWQSLQNPKLCYVQDTRIPSEAIRF